jgi:serine/threonine-protein kinase
MFSRESLPMAQPHADRNLLFGILALQMDFIDCDALIKGMHAWVLEKHKPLGQILREHEALRDDTHALLEAMVQKHLELHGGDAQKSLAALSSIGTVRRDLQQVADSDLQASLPYVSAARHPEDDPYPTRLPSVGASTSGGLRFRILRPHARGGLGQVFVARDEELHREVALKEILQQQADHPGHRARFLLEAEVTGGLEHPGIVPVYGLGSYPDGRPFYAMRFIKGNTFQDVIERFHQADAAGRAPSERALALRGLLRRFVDVCNAVAYAHARGVLHRDLKPSNAIVGNYGETLVVDWGLAKPLDSAVDVTGLSEEPLRPASAPGPAATRMGSVLGTPAFMSPEQAAGKLDQLGPASDLYSLGAMLYCLLTGKVPFEGPSVGDILQRVQRGEFAPPRQIKRSVPVGLQAICLKAMALKAGDRYGSARALADDIEHWLADEAVSAYRERWPARLGRWARRHRPLVASSSALLVSAVLALAVGLVVVGREQQRTALALASESQARQRTRQALDEMSSQVIEDWLSRRGRLEPAQQEFLQKALSYYEEFAASSGNSAEVRQGVADAHRRVGQIREKLGQHAEAEAAYRRALELWAHLAEDFPAEPQYRQQLARSYSNLGNLLQNKGRAQEAEAAYHDALQLQKGLAADFPNVPQYRFELARSHNNLAILLKDTGHPKPAEAAYRDALQLQKRLTDDLPNLPQYRLELAMSHNNLGNLLSDTGRPKEAEAAYHDALDLYKRLAADFPNVPQYRFELARSHNNLAILLKDTGHPKPAEAAYRDALQLQKRLTDDLPTVPDYQNDLGNTMDGLAELLHARRQYAAARQLLEQAHPYLHKALDTNPRHPVYRMCFCENRQLLAGTLLELGEHAAAAEAAADLARVAFKPADDAYNAACFFCRCIPLAEHDANLPEARRQELAKSYAEQALATLQQACANGYKDVGHLQKDKDLDPLRNRDDFKKLLAELEKAMTKEKPKDNRPEK